MRCAAVRRRPPGVARAIAAALAVVACGTGGCTADGPTPKSTVRVPIRSFQYTPSVLTVSVGDTVAWTNYDIVPHTATAADGSVDSGAIGTNAKWSYVALRKSTYTYHCTFHPSMQGTLRVE